MLCLREFASLFPATFFFLTACKAHSQLLTQSPAHAKSSVPRFWVLSPSLKWIQAGEARLWAGYIVCKNLGNNSPYILDLEFTQKFDKASQAAASSKLRYEYWNETGLVWHTYNVIAHAIKWRSGRKLLPREKWNDYFDVNLFHSSKSPCLIPLDQ